MLPHNASQMPQTQPHPSHPIGPIHQEAFIQPTLLILNTPWPHSLKYGVTELWTQLYEEMPHWLSVHTALVENPSLVPSAHVRWLTTVHNSTSGGRDPTPLASEDTCIHMQITSHIIKN